MTWFLRAHRFPRISGHWGQGYSEDSMCFASIWHLTLNFLETCPHCKHCHFPTPRLIINASKQSARGNHFEEKVSIFNFCETLPCDVLEQSCSWGPRYILDNCIQSKWYALPQHDTGHWIFCLKHIHSSDIATGRYQVGLGRIQQSLEGKEIQVWFVFPLKKVKHKLWTSIFVVLCYVIFQGNPVAKSAGAVGTNIFRGRHVFGLNMTLDIEFFAWLISTDQTLPLPSINSAHQGVNAFWKQ